MHSNYLHVCHGTLPEMNTYSVYPWSNYCSICTFVYGDMLSCQASNHLFSVIYDCVHN